MARWNGASYGFVGLNVLRLLSLASIILMFVALIMGFVEDVRAYHDGETMDEAVTEDCAYVPGTWIPMQTWGIFWVALHRMLLLIAAVALFFAELSWFRVVRLAELAKDWMPCLSDAKGLSAVGLVQIVVATSLLAHYLDEFPLVVGWILFVVGIVQLIVGIGFVRRPLKLARSLSAQRRQQAADLVAACKTSHDCHSLGQPCVSGPTVTLTILKRLLRRGNRTQQKPSINETFPSLELPSHQDLLREGMRRESHRRQASSVAIHIESETPSVVQSNIQSNISASSDAGKSTDKKQRASASSYESSNADGSIASNTQVRIGGYASPKGILARQQAQQRRAARPQHKSTRHGTEAASVAPEHKRDSTLTLRAVRRRSAAFVGSARNKLSTASLAERRKMSRRGIPNIDCNVVTRYTDDAETTSPMPPLPAYHPISRI